MNTNPNTKPDTPAIDVLKEAWPLYLQNPKITIGGSAFLYFVPLAIVGIPAMAIGFGGAIAAATQHGNMFMAMLPIILIAAPAFAAIYNYFRAGFVKMLLGYVQGEPVQFGDIMTVGKPWFVPILITKFVLGIAVALGGLLVIPGVYIAVRTAFAEFLIVDQNLDPIEAVKQSHEMVKGYAWQLVIFYALLFVANWVIGFVPVVQFFLPPVVAGFFDVALAMMYVNRRGGTAFAHHNEFDPNR